jgi:hypothetical protein
MLRHNLLILEMAFLKDGTKVRWNSNMVILRIDINHIVKITKPRQLWKHVNVSILMTRISGRYAESLPSRARKGSLRSLPKGRMQRLALHASCDPIQKYIFSNPRSPQQDISPNLTIYPTQHHPEADRIPSSTSSLTQNLPLTFLSTHSYFPNP